MVVDWFDKPMRFTDGQLTAAGIVPATSRYPTPTQADLVTMWRKDGRAVLSVTSAGSTQDYFVAAGVVSLLAREAVELLAASTDLR